MRKWVVNLICLLCAVAGLFQAGCQKGPAAPPSGPSKAERDYLSSRTWTSSDGRTLEGALVARFGEDGVIRRSADGALLRMPLRFLDQDNLRFLQDAFGSGAVPATIPGVWYVRTKLTIPGGEAWVAPDTRAAIGPRIAKVEAAYWLLLSELDGSQAKWVRVDNHSSSKVRVDSFLPRTELATQMNGGGSFIDELPCPRNDLYVIDARYGLTSRRINVTRAVMGFLAEGRLPLTVDPALFGLPPHFPDVWDLTVTWQRVGGGTLTRVVRDGSIFAWPEGH